MLHVISYYLDFKDFFKLYLHIKEIFPYLTCFQYILYLIKDDKNLPMSRMEILQIVDFF